MNDKELEQKAREIADNHYEVDCHHYPAIGKRDLEAAALEALQLKQKEVDRLNKCIEDMENAAFLGDKAYELAEIEIEKQDKTITSLQERCERLEGELEQKKRLTDRFKDRPKTANIADDLPPHCCNDQALTETKGGEV